MVPSIRQLEYFVAVADRLSFGQAADACHVTQPGLSAQIRQLEELLRVRLFERDSRRVLLTRAGEALLPRARDILTAAEELSQAAAAFTRPLSGTLRLGVIPTIAPYLLPDVMAPVHRTYPELRLLVHEGETAAMVEQLSNGQLDLLVLALQADLGDAETHELFKDPFVLAVPSGHRLTAKKSVSESDLEGENVLLLEDGHWLRSQALAVCERVGANEVGDFRASSLSTLAQMVANGIGVTLIPSLAASVEIARSTGLVAIPFAEPAPYRTIGLAWRKTSPRKEEFCLLSELLCGPARHGSAL